MLKLDTSKKGISQIFKDHEDEIIAYMLSMSPNWISSGDVWRAIAKKISQPTVTGYLIRLSELDYIEATQSHKKGAKRKYRINMTPATFETIIIFDLVKGIVEAFPDNELSKELNKTVMSYAVDKHIEERTL